MPNSAPADWNVADLAVQLGNMVEHPYISQPNPDLRPDGTHCTLFNLGEIPKYVVKPQKRPLVAFFIPWFPGDQGLRDAAGGPGNDFHRVDGVPLRRRVLPPPPEARRRRGEVGRVGVSGAFLCPRASDRAHQVRLRCYIKSGSSGLTPRICFYLTFLAF